MTAPTPPKNDWVDKDTAGHPPADWSVGAAAQNTIAANIIYLLSQSAGKQPSNALLTAISSLVDPNTDKLIFWDDSASTLTYLSLGTNLSITGTTLNATGGGAGGATNLTTTQTTTDVTVVSDTGSDATIPAATGSLAGAMTAADRVKFATIATNADVTNTTTVTAAGAVMTSTKNTANGVAGLNASGQVAAAQLPSYVDDVVEYANFAAFPATGETGKIYVAINTPPTTPSTEWRWSGTVYVQMVSSPGTTDAVPEGTTNLYYTNARADARIAAGITGKQALNANLTSISTLVDPNADRIAFWDDSAGAWAFLTLGTNLSITGTTLNATGSGGGNVAADTHAAAAKTSPVNADEIPLVDTEAGNALKRVTVSDLFRMRQVPFANQTSMTVNVDITDIAVNTGLTGTVTLNNPTGTPGAEQEFIACFTGTASRPILHGTAFDTTPPLPTTTSGTTRLDALYRWNAATSKWRCIQYTGSAGGYAPGGTDVALGDGGTGASLTAPVADRIMFYDVSAGSTAYLTAGTGLTITGTTMTASGGTGGASNVPSGWADVVADHGAVADGVTNDRAAFVAAAATGLPVWVPAGAYFFSGAGLSQNDLVIAGTGAGKTLITLGAGVYFIDGTNDVNTLKVSGINFDAGAGVLRSTYTGTAVRGYRIFEDCRFHDYTATCIGHRHADSPYWAFRFCEFRGANDSTTIGIALNGLTDDSMIHQCTFELNRVHVKVKEGANFHIGGGTSFLRFLDYTTNPRIDIWIVPRTQAEVTAAGGNFADAGSGFTVMETKFGNEGLSGNDYRVVIADALAGNFETALPQLAANSTSVWIGGTFTNLHNSLIGGTCPPFIYSTTPNLYAVQAGNFQHIGSDSLAAARVLQLRTATGFDPTINAIGPVMTGADPINGQVLVAATSGTLTGQPKYIGGGS